MSGTTIDGTGVGSDPGAGAGAAGTGSPAPWYAAAGLDDGTVGWLQTKGWDKDPVAAAAGAAKAYREAERFIGAPPDRVLKLPDATDTAGWKGVWNKLGVPENADGYDLSGLKSANGEPLLEQGLIDALRQTALTANVPKDALPALAKALVDHQAATTTAATAARQAALETERATLAASWGANAEAFKQVARNAALTLKVEPEMVDGLEKVIGYAKTMEFFRDLGQRMGEDRFVTSQGGPTDGRGLTREQAVMEQQRLSGDKAFVDRYLAGDVAAAKQMRDLAVIIAGGDDTEASRARAFTRA